LKTRTTSRTVSEIHGGVGLVQCTSAHSEKNQNARLCIDDVNDVTKIKTLGMSLKEKRFFIRDARLSIN
jgi:hypothetical protein